jgi:hypothetical protein
MNTHLENVEWWAEISEPYVRLARLVQKVGGSCEVLDSDGIVHRFNSYSEAALWLGEDEYSLVAHLIEEGDLPVSFAVPMGSTNGELLRQMQNRGPELQAFLDRKFYESLGTERRDVACRRPGCTRGAVEMSALCAQHHFENVIGRPYNENYRNA